MNDISEDIGSNINITVNGACRGVVEMVPVRRNLTRWVEDNVWMYDTNLIGKKDL